MYLATVRNPRGNAGSSSLSWDVIRVFKVGSIFRRLSKCIFFYISTRNVFCAPARVGDLYCNERVPSNLTPPRIGLLRITTAFS